MSDLFENLRGYLSQPGHDAPPYSLPWLAAFRKNAFSRMQQLAGKTKKDTGHVRLMRKKLAKYQTWVAQLQKAIAEFEGPCPHPLESMSYSEHGREDSYGSY